MKNIFGLTVAAGLAVVLTLVVRGQLQMNEQIATFERQLDYLQLQLSERPPTHATTLVSDHEAATGTHRVTADTPLMADAMVASNRDASEESAFNLSAAPPEQASVVAAAPHPALERGYIYAQDWEDMEQSVASMSAAAQKQHWDRVFQAIEAGELEIYDE